MYLGGFKKVWRAGGGGMILDDLEVLGRMWKIFGYLEGLGSGRKD